VRQRAGEVDEVFCCSGHAGQKYLDGYRDGVEWFIFAFEDGEEEKWRRGFFGPFGWLAMPPNFAPILRFAVWRASSAGVVRTLPYRLVGLAR
jgi:hypothetical protein